MQNSTNDTSIYINKVTVRLSVGDIFSLFTVRSKWLRLRFSNFIPKSDHLMLKNLIYFWLGIPKILEIIKRKGWFALNDVTIFNKTKSLIDTIASYNGYGWINGLCKLTYLLTLIPQKMLLHLKINHQRLPSIVCI